MTDIAEIERIEREALADESQQAESAASPPGQAGGIDPPGDVAEEFADFLDMAAMAGGQYFLPTIPQRFNHQANINVATAAVKLCERYGYEPRKVLLGGDSVLSLWLGLGLSLLIPGWACYQDYKVLKAKEVKTERGGSGDSGGQQPGE